MDIRTYAGRFEQAASVLCFIIIRENQGGYREFGGLMGTTRFLCYGLRWMASERCASWKCIIKTALIHKQESKF